VFDGKYKQFVCLVNFVGINNVSLMRRKVGKCCGNIKIMYRSGCCAENKL